MSNVGPVGIYKISRFFNKVRLSVISKLFDYLNRLVFGCWLPGSCKSGNGLVLGYWGLAVVIHKDAVIGDNVHIDQCVTIGGNGTEFGVPEISSNVYIGAGAKILGPIKIGSGCIVGANSVVTINVPDNCVVAGVPARIIKKDIAIDEFLYHLRVKND